jgi:hypothetical protein
MNNVPICENAHVTQISFRSVHFARTIDVEMCEVEADLAVAQKK